MIEPKTGRDMPSGRRIAVLISLALLALRKQTIDAIRTGKAVPNPYHALFALFVPIAKEIERELIAGGKYSLINKHQLSSDDSSFSENVDFIGKFEIAPQKTKNEIMRVGSNSDDEFDRFKQWTRIESQRRSMAVIREISDTTAKAVNHAIETGKANGEPVSRMLANITGEPAEMTIQERIAELNVFDRDRAKIIAENVAVSSMFVGQAEMGKRLGSIGLIWHVSDNPCKVCQSLDGQKRLHGEWFYEWPNAPPPYRYVYESPAHPNCKCDCQNWWVG